MKYNAHGQEMEMEPIFSTMLREYFALLCCSLTVYLFFYDFLCFRAVPRRRREYRVSSNKKKKKRQRETATFV